MGNAVDAGPHPAHGGGPVVRTLPAMAGTATAHDAAAPEARLGDPDFVTAVARAFALLRAFRRGDRALGNKDFAARTGLPKSTVARLTHTLTVLGYLEYLPPQEKYGLGIGLLRFGQNYLQGLDVRNVARPWMQQLADEVKATVALAANQGNDMVFLELCHGDPNFALRVGVGERVPRGTSALGRAWLAAQLPEQRAARVAEFLRRLPREQVESVRRGLDEAVRDFQKFGVCLSLGDWNEAVHGVSVPMVAADGSKVLAFSASFPARQAGRQHLLHEVAPRLAALRDRVAAALGGVF